MARRELWKIIAARMAHGVFAKKPLHRFRSPSARFLDADKAFPLCKREFHCFGETAFFLCYECHSVNDEQHLIPNAFVEEGCLIEPMQFAVDLDASEPRFLQPSEGIFIVFVTF